MSANKNMPKSARCRAVLHIRHRPDVNADVGPMKCSISARRRADIKCFLGNVFMYCVYFLLKTIMEPDQNQATNNRHEESMDAMLLSPESANENESLSRRHEPVSRTDPPLTFPPPPADWQFNKFLGDIADSLMMDDFVKIKHQFSGEGGIGLSVLEGIKTPRDLFIILKNRGYLNRNNMIYLQSAFKVIGRIDLVQKAIDYCKETRDVLHFYPATEEPENGYMYVRLHVDGIDYSNCTDGYLQRLRESLASIVFLPPQFIMIAGIEPSSSMLLTFMVPEQYCELLLNMLKSGEVFPDLHNLGVDVICISEIEFNLKVGVSDAEKVETEQQSKLKTVYEQLQIKTSQLEITEKEMLNLLEEVRHLNDERKTANEKIFEAEIVQNTLRKIIETETSASGKDVNEKGYEMVEKCLGDFKESLKKVDDQSKSLVMNLLNIHSHILWVGTAECFRHREQVFQNEIRRLRLLLIPMETELVKYQFLSNIEKEKLEDMLMSLQQRFSAKMQVKLSDDVLVILRKISRQLRHKEKLKIEKMYEWKKDDKMKESMDTDQSYFLAGILHKEIETKQKLIDYEKFISGVLEDVGREDLKKKFFDLMKSSRQSQRPSRQSQETPSTSLSQDPAMWNTIANMAKQVEEIHQQMNSAIGGFQLGSDPLLDPLFDFKSKLNRGRELSTDREDTSRERHASAEQV